MTAPGKGDLLEIGDSYVISVVHDEYDVPTIQVRDAYWDEAVVSH